MKPTGDPFILEMSIAPTDFLERKTYPTYLYYNPFDLARSVQAPSAPEGAQLYDLSAHEFLHVRGQSDASLQIPAKGARVIVLIPPGAQRQLRNRTLFCGDVAVDYAVPRSA